jgi:hypothetical protein
VLFGTHACEFALERYVERAIELDFEIGVQAPLGRL